ncbi:hypothetical protein JXJ21_17830 [candidate division KSB1 bacterium]|nr:hypothetical protein [candidate division KSB1 bacterium]
MGKKIICFMLFLALLGGLFAAQNPNELYSALTDMRILREEIRKKALPILVMLKQLETAEDVSSPGRAKVINPAAPVHESNLPESAILLQSRINDEFPILEKRDDWYRIQLPDDRQGWIQESQVQEIAAPLPVRKSPAGISKVELGDVMRVAGQWMPEISAGRDSAEHILGRAKQGFLALPAQQQQLLKPLYAELEAEYQKIVRYFSYVNYFYTEYAAYYEEPPAKKSVFNNTSGQVSAQLGTVSYTSTQDKSTSARNINLNLRKVINELSSVSAAVSSRREILETPYSTNNYRLAYQYNIPNGLNIASHAAMHTFSDDSLARNSFSRYNAGYQLRYPLKPEMDLYHDFDYLNKSLKEKGPNAYSTSQFNVGLRYRRDQRTVWTFSTRGLIQSSDAHYLDFKRYVPQVTWQRRNPDGALQAQFEFETLGYHEDAKQNNYRQERLEFRWQRPNSSRQVMLIGKQYPNSNQINYIKLGGKMQWIRSQMAFSTNMKMSLLLVYFPEIADAGSHYLDFRLDRNQLKPVISYGTNLFVRLWSNPDAGVRRYHLIDFYQTVGYAWQQIRIGPLLGAHLLVHKDERFIKKDGNSLRTGLDFKGNFVIQKALLYLSLQYEYNFLFGEEYQIDPNTGDITPGELKTRHPTTLQAMVDFRLPISRSFDLQALFSSYDVNLDLNEEPGTDMLTEHGRNLFQAGLIYRFER